MNNDKNMKDTDQKIPNSNQLFQILTQASPHQTENNTKDIVNEIQDQSNGVTLEKVNVEKSKKIFDLTTAPNPKKLMIS